MIRVMVVDDQHLVRQGICSLLQLSTEVQVVAEASNGQEALQLLETTPVDVMLLDLRMPVCDGLATLQALRGKDDAPAILILTTFDDDELVLASIEAGANGYLLKDVTFEVLIQAVKTLQRGERLHQPVALTSWAEREHHPINSLKTGATEALSPREREILRLLSGGYSNKEVARALDLAEGTIKNHVSAILAKLGVRDRTRAVLKALEKKLI